MPVPVQPKIYHICHVDRLPSIIGDGCLWSDAEIAKRSAPGTTIGMNHIKERRLNQLSLASHPDLRVGGCVPFYFCPRSVMLYLIHKGNHADMNYRGGQTDIVHLQADLHATVKWANEQPRRWAFSLSNAGSVYFEDRADLAMLGEINWDAVAARDWRNYMDKKQAEFLLEYSFPWQLVERIGVYSNATYQKAVTALSTGVHRPPVVVEPTWYY